MTFISRVPSLFIFSCQFIMHREIIWKGSHRNLFRITEINVNLKMRVSFQNHITPNYFSFFKKKCFVIKLYGDHFVLIKYYNPLICEDFFCSLVLLLVLNMDIMKLTLHLGVIIIKVWSVFQSQAIYIYVLKLND